MSDKMVMQVAVEDVAPVIDSILIKPGNLSQSIVKSGLYIKQDAQDRKVKMGTVVAQGPGRSNTEGKMLPMPCKVGDHVLLGDMGTISVVLGGETYWLTEARQIIAVVGKYTEIEDERGGVKRPLVTA